MLVETEEIKKRYSRRTERAAHRVWSPLLPYNLACWQERERALAAMFRQHLAERELGELTCLEVGCGSGTNLLQLIKLGFAPSHLTGNELLKERANIAIEHLPKSVEVLEGDALELHVPENSLDIVYQSTVFTSILDNHFQNKLAQKMWSWVKPGGGILWYDFIYNNPKNPDVRGVPVKRIREFFPEGHCDVRKVTLAPPIGRRLGRISPALLPLAGLFPFLRSHVLVWIGKS